MAIYMKFGGAYGSATLEGYEGWSEISDLEWNAQANVRYVKNNKSPQMSHIPQLSQITFKKLYDKASGDLVTSLLKAEVANTVTIKRLDGDVITEQYVLTDVIVSEYDFEGWGHRDADSEIITLDFTQWEYKSAEIDAKLNSTNTASLNFNVRTGKANG